MAALGSIKRIFVLMLENRSFDHMLGYLSLKGALPVNGLRHPLDPHTNTYNGQPYPLFPLTSLRVPDPLHDRQHIRIQIDGGSMHGFVASYAINHAVSRDLPPPVMGYYTEAEVPITDFFARQFAVCDSWFAPFPTGTQPNRLMAMAGYSLIEDNEEPLPHHDLVYDWLTRSGVPWCVYHEEFPLFMMMPEWIPHIVMDGTHFRRLSDLPRDILNDDLPQVVFIEPTYTDAPHYKEPSDAHPPSSISHSENFLRNVYLALVTADLWKDCVLIVTYDEHGGFFDHEPPRPLPTPIPRDAEYGDQFMTTGLRVPALIVSPFVSAAAERPEWSPRSRGDSKIAEPATRASAPAAGCPRAGARLPKRDPSHPGRAPYSDARWAGASHRVAYGRYILSERGALVSGLLGPA